MKKQWYLSISLLVVFFVVIYLANTPDSSTKNLEEGTEPSLVQVGNPRDGVKSNTSSGAIFDWIHTTPRQPELHFETESKTTTGSPSPLYLGGSYPTTPLSEQITTKSPQIDSITPSIVTSTPYEIVISGSGFTTTGNTVVIPSESQSGFENIASADGKTIKVKLPFSLAQKMRDQIMAMPSSVNKKQFIETFLSNLTGSTVAHANTTTYIGVSVSVSNINGVSNPVLVQVDLGALLRE